jgi:anti-sigma regulatory factor (Ser/Thr protein kinase)
MADGLEDLAPPSGDALEDTVVALDELMSNAIRHGRAPVEVEICACDDGLLVLVSDRASDKPPRPTSTRDPAQGGMGLGIVAKASTASGWFSEGDVKVVWAVMPDGKQA